MDSAGTRRLGLDPTLASNEPVATPSMLPTRSLSHRLRTCISSRLSISGFDHTQLLSLTSVSCRLNFRVPKYCFLFTKKASTYCANGFIGDCLKVHSLHVSRSPSLTGLEGRNTCLINSPFDDVFQRFFCRLPLKSFRCAPLMAVFLITQNDIS